MALLDLLRADGLEPRRVAGTSGGEYACPCPKCGGRDRFRVWPDHSGGARFWCRGCEWRGDEIQYLRDQRRLSFRDASGAAGKPLADMLEKRATTHAKPPPRRRDSNRGHMPSSELQSWWATCPRVGDAPRVMDWLGSRGFDLAMVRNIEDRDLARVLPAGRCPGWARTKLGSWAETGHTCLLPVFDATGTLRGVRARRLIPEEPKELPPSGYRAGGLVFADPLARMLLQTGVAPDWWIQANGADAPTIIIAEGGPDFLTWASHFGDQEAAPAVFGIFSGAWTPEIAARIPDGCRVLVRPHLKQDGSGYADGGSVRYAKQIIGTLHDRCDVRIWRRGRS